MRLTLLILVQLFALSAIAQDSALFQVGHAQNVNTVSWSPDSSKLISHSSPEDSLIMWDARSGKVLWKKNTAFVQNELETYTLNAFAWSPDQQVIASTGYNGKIQLWEAETGKLIWNIPAHSDEGNVVKFTADGRFLVSAADPEDSGGEVKLWDVSSGKLLRNFGGESERVIALRVDEKRDLLTAGSFTGELRTWRFSSGTHLGTRSFKPCGASNGFARGSAYSPDMRWFVARCGDRTVLTELASLKPVKVWKTRSDWDKEVTFSGDSKVLAFNDLSGYRVIKIGGLRETKVDDVINSGFTFELNADGALLAEGGGYRAEGVRVSRIADQKVLVGEGHPGIIESLAFSKDGSHFASGSTDQIVRVWSTNEKRLVHSLNGHTDDVLIVEFDDDGKTLISKGEKETIQWDLNSGQILKIEKVSTERKDDMLEKAMSVRGDSYLEDRGDEKPFALINSNNQDLIKEFTVLPQIQGFKFTPDGKHFISAAYFDPLKLWSVERGTVIREFDIGYSTDNVVAFSPDGRTFLTGGWNQNILHFEMKSGKLLWSLFPVDQTEMSAQRAQEARRLKSLRDKAEAERLADLETRPYIDRVYIEFSHYGDMTDPGHKRMLESSTRKDSVSKKPAAEANAVWLRLHNRTPLPIEIPTQSAYLDSKCFFAFPDGPKVFGLCDDREINVWHGLQDAAGEWIPFGFDFGSSSILLPNTSVLFPVPRRALENNNAVVFDFTFQKVIGGKKVDDYGSEHPLKFTLADAK